MAELVEKLKKEAVWSVLNPENAKIDNLAESVDVDRIIAKLLINRGIESAKEATLFLENRLSALTDPFKMPGMEVAANRVAQAIKGHEKIVIFGDYDVDGITATAVLVRFLREVGADVGWLLPDREKDGYGLNEASINRVAAMGGRLLITVDNGINAVAEAKLAKSLGIDLIITDHHQPPEKLPEAVAVVNPHFLSEDDQAFGLAGVGVAFKLAVAVRRVLYEDDAEREKAPRLLKYMDLAAVGTVADSVLLTKENRVIAANGIHQLCRTEWAGLLALMRIANIDPSHVTSIDIGFGLAPRMNAVGRLGSAEKALKLLLTDDKREATKIATELNADNQRRKEMTVKIYDDALSKIDELKIADDKAIVIAGDWKSGIIGIVASRLVGAFNIPVALVAMEANKPGRGSVRTIPAFDAGAALLYATDTLIKHGGHRGAAGFSVTRDNYDRFRELFIEFAKLKLSGNDLKKEIVVDGEVDIGLFDLPFIERIDRLAPFGEGNRAPLFLAKNVQVENIWYMGNENQHVRLTLTGANSKAVGFGIGEFFAENDSIEKKRYDFLFAPEINVFNGNISPQLRIVDFRD